MMIYDSPCEMIVSFPDGIKDRLPPTWSPPGKRLQYSEASQEVLEGQVVAVGYVGECLNLATE